MSRWKFQIMQESEGMTGILEYTGRQPQKNKTFAKQGEELQQLHLILGTPNSERSIIGSLALVWCLLALNYFSLKIFNIKL